MKYSEAEAEEIVELLKRELMKLTPYDKIYFRSITQYGIARTRRKYFLNKHIFNRNHWRRQYNDN